MPYNATSSNTTTSTITIADSSGEISTSIEATIWQTSEGIATSETTSIPEAKPTANSTDISTVTATPSSSTETKPEPAAEEDSDSPLDNANFLSFEEWKRQNLAKTGQSPDDVGRAQAANPDRPRPVINNALDSLGEEAEIDLDFTGFGGAVKPPGADSQSVSSVSTSEHTPGSGISRSKDAGKTCKERTNYASFDCSATILKSNKECKSASSVLVENKDSYMLNVCSASNKFFIVELCTDIQIDTIVLANYEFFSSSFRHFRVSVSDRYPVKMEKWKELGTFEARNTREIQAFLVENPLIWAKYLRIEFLTQYGTEYYCPVSLLRVHGTTMIEDFRHQAGFAAGDEEDATLETEALATPVAQEPAVVNEDVAKSTTEPVVTVKDTPTESVTKGPPIDTATPQVESSEGPASQSTQNSSDVTLDEHGAVKAIGAFEPLNVNLTCESVTTSSSAGQPTPTTSAEDSEVSDTTTQVASAASSPIHSDAPSSDAKGHTYTSTTSQTATATDDVHASHPQTYGPPRSPSSSTDSVAQTTINSTVDATGNPASSPSADDRQSSDTATVSNTTSSVTSAVSAQQSHVGATTNSTRTSTASSTGAQPAQPSTQESFFKSFHKRLLQLESNSTLSLQYIEEQSRILRDAFSKVEKRQVGSTSKFLSQLNETVMTELHGFRQAYDQLWQSTVIELEGQRETYQREMLALSARLTMVADELVWQKRMGIVQSTLLLLCLALVLFGRSSNGYIEMPLMQQMMNRSTAALRAGWESPPNSPSPDSRSPVSLFRRKLWRSSTEPAGETGNLTDSEVSRPPSKDGPPNVLVEPPSPSSPATQSDFDDEYGEDSSPHAQSKDPGASQGPLSPKKRKRPKKPPNWPKENSPTQRVKSPLAM